VCGCAVGSSAFKTHRRPKLSSSPEVPRIGHRCYTLRRESDDRPRSTHASIARCGLGCVAGANSRCASAQFVGRGSAARPPHLVGGCGFGPSVLPRSTPVTYEPRAHRPVENRTTAHGARTPALRGADLIVWLGPTRDALLPSSLAEASPVRPPHLVGGCGFVPSSLPRSTPMARAACSHCPVENRTTAHGALARTALCRLGCVAGANSRRAPAQFVGRGSAARPSHQGGGSDFGPSGSPRTTAVAHGQRSHCPVEFGRPPTKRTRALRGADFVVWLGPTRNALLPSSFAEALPHGHCIRSAAAAWYRRCSVLDSRAARTARS